MRFKKTLVSIVLAGAIGGIPFSLHHMKPQISSLANFVKVNFQMEQERQQELKRFKAVMEDYKNNIEPKSEYRAPAFTEEFLRDLEDCKKFDEESKMARFRYIKKIMILKNKAEPTDEEVWKIYREEKDSYSNSYSNPNGQYWRHYLTEDGKMIVYGKREGLPIVGRVVSEDTSKGGYLTEDHYFCCPANAWNNYNSEPSKRLDSEQPHNSYYTIKIETLEGLIPRGEIVEVAVFGAKEQLDKTINVGDRIWFPSGQSLSNWLYQGSRGTIYEDSWNEEIIFTKDTRWGKKEANEIHILP